MNPHSPSPPHALNPLSTSPTPNTLAATHTFLVIRASGSGPIGSGDGSTHVCFIQKMRYSKAAMVQASGWRVMVVVVEARDDVDVDMESWVAARREKAKRRRRGRAGMVCGVEGVEERGRVSEMVGPVRRAVRAGWGRWRGEGVVIFFFQMCFCFCGLWGWVEVLLLLFVVSCC